MLRVVGAAGLGAVAGALGHKYLGVGEVGGLDANHHKDAAAAERGKATTPADFGRKHTEDELYVHRIALTGGPCGGKSSSLKHFRKNLVARGFDVYTVPEIPTLMMNNGCAFPGLADKKKLVAFESALMDLQLQAERTWTQVAASTGRPSVVVMDRGLMDIKAYLPEAEWKMILEASDLYNEEYFNGRYDMVLHCVSTADGCVDVYEKQKANNPTRQETAKQARALDRRMGEVWAGHPNVFKVVNPQAETPRDAACKDAESCYKLKLERGTAAVVAHVTAAAK